jgi:hypothetical protein
MIDRVGLLTRQSLISDQLPEAVERYRRTRPGPRAYHGSSDKRFRAVHSHQAVKVAFLGVFDTVGALGVPGAFRRKHQFHDVKLSTTVRCARQALAIDEHRMKFEPSLWEPCPDPDPDQSVKQVWFEGAHSDVGGGYAETGLSDTALEWMTGEARDRGLVFDDVLLRTYLDCGSPAIRHDSLTAGYRVLNIGSQLRLRLGRPRAGDDPPFTGDQRVLDRVRALGVRVASSAAVHYRDDCEDEQRTAASANGGRPSRREWYRPRNLSRFSEHNHGLDGHEEVVVAHP